MTVRELIRRALQMLRVVSPGETPTSDELADGLIAYNALISSLRGHGVGNALRPATARNGLALVGGLHSEAAIGTPDAPSDGARFGVTGACVVTSDLTIEGGTVSAPAVWFYRADLATWVPEAEDSLDDEPPFPSSFHDGLAAMLATRLPDYGAEITAGAAMLADECHSRLTAAYRPRVNPGCDSGVLLMSRRPWSQAFR